MTDENLSDVPADKNNSEGFNLNNLTEAEPTDEPELLDTLQEPVEPRMVGLTIQNRKLTAFFGSQGPEMEDMFRDVLALRGIQLDPVPEEDQWVLRWPENIEIPLYLSWLIERLSRRIPPFDRK